MSLFEYDILKSPGEKAFQITKSEKFRLEIRRKQQDQKFIAIRKQFAESLKSLTFLQKLHSQKDNINAKKIGWVIQGLQGGQNNANFYQDIIDMQLQPYLCELILRQDILLQQKSKIMKSLVQLLYFSPKIPKQFIQNNLIDYIRIKLSKIRIQSQFEQDFVFYAATLVLNLTNFKNAQFNDYMTQSDFLPTLQKIVDGNHNIQQLRQTVLKIYSNIFMSNLKELRFVFNVLYQILLDQRNSQNQSLLCCTLTCLAYSAKIPDFWLYLQTRTRQFGQICFQIQGLALIILHNFTQDSFNLFVDFINNLYQQYESSINQQADFYLKQFPKGGLLKLFYMLKKQQSCTKTKQIICKTIKMFSRLPTLSKALYNSHIQQSQFIQSIMTRYIVQNPISKKYLVRILTKILTQDKIIIDVYINNGIVDVVRDLLNSQFFKQQQIEVIDLVQKLIQIQEQLRDKQKKQVNKIYNVFYDRGIIRDIEKLQDEESVDIYKRAQIFMVKISQLMANTEYRK